MEGRTKTAQGAPMNNNKTSSAASSYSSHPSAPTMEGGAKSPHVGVVLLTVLNATAEDSG